MRRVLRILIVLAIVAVALVLGAEWYLHSHAVTRKVETQLAALYGGPVQVEKAALGLKHTTLHGVRLFEEGDEAQTHPWADLGTVTADVSLWELVNGTAMPRRVGLSGAKVTLRFDKKGHLLTRFPSGGQLAGTPGSTGQVEKMPDINLEQSELTLRKEGGPEVVLTGVKVQVKPEAGKLVISGSAANPQWGKLELAGTYDEKAKAVVINLRSDDEVNVTQAMLNALPFISPTIWEEVQAEGTTPVRATLRYDLSAHAMHYRVELEPKGTRVTVPAAHFHATGASGKLIIDDLRVHLRDVKGKAYGGDVALNANLDFSGAASQLDFEKLKAHGLDVHRLPASWGLPAEIDGRLNAEGSVQLTLENGNIHTTGDAHAEIRDAHIAGQPVDGPIQIELSPEGSPLQLGAPGEGKADEDSAQEQGEAAAQPAGKDAPRKDAPRYLTIELRLKNADLGQMAEKLKFNLPFGVAGRLSFQGRAAIPVNSTKDARTYRFKGSAVITEADIAGVRLERASTDAVYEDGVLRLDKLSGTFAPAEGVTGKATSRTFQGKIRAQVAPAGDLTVELRMEGVALSGIAAKLGLKEPVEGTASATVFARVPVERVKESEAWQATGRVTSPRAKAFGWTLEKAEADMQLKDGTLTLSDLTARVEGAELKGSGDLQVKEPYRYKASLTLKGADLSAVQRLAADLRPGVDLAGRLTVTADVSGTLEPFKVATSGTAAATGLKVDTVTLQDVEFGWEGTTDRLKVKELRARLYGGEITGGAVVPLEPQAAGNVDLKLKGIDVGALLKEAGFPLPIEGKANGSVKGTLPAAPAGKERPVDIALDLKSTKLQVQGLDAEGLQGKARYQKGELSYDFEAKTLGGTLEVEGKVPRAAPKASAEAGGGQVKLRGARLDRLAAWLSGGRGRTPLPLGGRADADLIFRHEGPGRTAVGNGQVVLTDVSWDGTDWLPRVQGNLELTPQRLLLREATASLAEGTVRLRMALGRKPSVRSWFRVDIDSAEAARLLAPWPSLAENVQGLVSASLRGTPGSQWAAHGTVLLARGKVYGVNVSEWRLPVGIVYAPKQGRGRLEIRDSSAEVANGRATAEATYRWGRWDKQLQGKINFTNVDLRGVLHKTAETAYLGGGRITGRLDFSGPGLTSLDDLTATLDAKLAQTQAMQFPVLQQLGPTLGLGGSSSFQNGQVRARLSGGVVRVERLSLQGGPGDIFITGSITTTDRLDLNVHANTARLGLNLVGAKLLGIRVPFQGTIPVRMLGSLNTFLSNRLIQLRVLGTIRSPTVQIRPLPILQDEGIRFFFRSAAGA